jgi:hypothetical protein
VLPTVKPRKATIRKKAPTTPARKAVINLSLPPRIDLIPQVHATLRFLNTSATQSAVTVTDLLGACGVIGSASNSKVVCIASSVRLHRVRIWPASGGMCNVEWGTFSGIGKDTIRNSDTPTGVTQTGCAEYRPPRNTLYSDWLEPGGSTIFAVSCTTGSIIDVEVSWTQCSGLTEPIQVTVATAVVGTIYYLALDGPTQNRYPPNILATTS